MNLKNIDLLLKDLSARLPYGIKVQIKDEPTFPFKVIAVNDYRIIINHTNHKGYSVSIEYNPKPYNIEDVKPYLRPLSSMTEKEKIEFLHICGFSLHYDWDFGANNGFKNINWHSLERTCIDRKTFVNAIDWLNTHHFDYRGLIPMGLALKAKKGMYK